MLQPKLDSTANYITGFENTYLFLDQDSSVFTAPKNETLTIVDIFTKDKEVQRELRAQEGATLHYIKISKSKKSVSVKYINDIKEDATLNMSLFEFESSDNIVETKLKSKSANFTINALLDLKDDSKVLYDVQTTHQNKSFSDIVFKNLLNDKSSVKLNMFSVVEDTAAFSKAFQNSKTILLSDDSSIAVTPHLEISIDELEASHGATYGDLEKEALYYLQSRGIKESDAKIILLDAIRNEVFMSLENEKLVEYIKGIL